MENIVELIVTAQQADPKQLTGSVAIIVDVLRATTTIVTLLSRGIKKIYPAVTVEKAFSLKTQHSDSLLCGERGGDKVPGFDFGNSPAEFAAAPLAASAVILTTTNGTLAVSKSMEAECVFAGCLRNASAVAEVSADACRSGRVVIVCAGTEGAFSLDDFFAAGIIAAALQGRGFGLTDAAQAAALLAQQPVRDVLNVDTCRHVRLLQSKGFECDIDYAFDLDAESIVPVYNSKGGFFSL
jgi:2-phosphosulfolactate phosphatase